MSEKTAPLVDLANVGQEYGTQKKHFTAVKDIRLSLFPGEFVALLGPSGCGKSTLLRIITGLQRPTSGVVRYNGEPLQGVNKHAAIVFQNFALFPWLTVQENVEVALKARGVPGQLRTPRALDLLDRVGLDGFETAYPRELSGGMRQKVGFARAMAVEPELLCLDEPFSALDVLSAETLRNELIELWTSGKIPTKSVLMVTHNIDEAVLMADRIVVMEKEPGRIVRELKVDLPRPRERKDAKFSAIVDEVFAILAGQTRSEAEEHGTAPGQPGRTRALPHVTANQLTGLLEHLNDSNSHKVDIYRLAEEFRVDSDYILRLIECAELLGFAVVGHGDIAIAPLGESFAEASIQARKEIFAGRIKRLPFFQWLVALLRADAEKSLELEVVETALELEFPREEAARQLETAIDWGRYAELLAYDDNSETIYLEPNA